MVDHDVRKDYAGWGQHERYTCFSQYCPVKPGDTLLRQPYMTDAEWGRRKATYFANHPCKEVGRA